MILEVVQSKWSLTWYDPLGPRMCVLELMNRHVLQTLREQLKVPRSMCFLMLKYLTTCFQLLATIWLLNSMLYTVYSWPFRTRKNNPSNCAVTRLLSYIYAVSGQQRFPQLGRTSVAPKRARKLKTLYRTSQIIQAIRSTCRVAPANSPDLKTIHPIVEMHEKM